MANPAASSCTQVVDACAGVGLQTHAHLVLKNAAALGQQHLSSCSQWRWAWKAKSQIWGPLSLEIPWEDTGKGAVTVPAE